MNWSEIKNYKRNFLLNRFSKGKEYDIKVFAVEGKKIGLKDITCELKFNRLVREGKIKLVDENKKFAIV